MTRESIAEGKNIISKIESLGSKLKIIEKIDDRSDTIIIMSPDQFHSIELNGDIKAHAIGLIVDYFSSEINELEDELAAL